MGLQAPSRCQCRDASNSMSWPINAGISRILSICSGTSCRSLASQESTWLTAKALSVGVYEPGTGQVGSIVFPDGGPFSKRLGNRQSRPVRAMK